MDYIDGLCERQGSMPESKHPLHVYRWQNDMVMVFDNCGDQIPELQGKYAEVKDKVLATATDDTRFYHDVWTGFHGPGSLVYVRIDTR